MIASGMRESTEVQRLFMQYWVAAGILAAANLGLADAIGETALPATSIAERLDSEPATILRLLRNLAGVGIFREGPKGCFVHTPLSAALRNNAVGGAGHVIQSFGLKTVREAMTAYEAAIRTGRSAFRISQGQDFFECLQRRPEEAELYGKGMSQASNADLPILEMVDFSDIRLLVDVGGGDGGFLAASLQRNPSQRGILFDLPHVVEEARFNLMNQGVAMRCALIAGDLRQDVPANGDGYILKNILHGYSDEDCLRLLRRIRDSGAAKTQVFIIENLMPEDNAPAPCKIFDLFLLLGGNGARVRTEAELCSLLYTAGLAVSRYVPILGNLGVVEAYAR
jgi:hypothetical protein